jgi:thiol-disulfide isomerase/thioredoxin
MKPTHSISFKQVLIFVLPLFYCHILTAQNWMYIASVAAQDIGVGRNGSVWAATTEGNVLRWSGTAWENVPGTASRVAVDGEGAAWVVTADSLIYKYDMATKYWQLKPGTAKDVGIGGDGSVWIIGTNSVQGGYDIYKWDWGTSSWKNIPGGAVRIAVEPSGNAWIVNNSGSVFRYNGSSWDQKPGILKDIGIGANGTIWCTGQNDAIYKWDGTNWQGQSGGASWVGVGPDGNAWVVNAGGEVWRTNNPTKLPDFTKVDLKNVQHNLYNELAGGKTVVLDFSAVWCAPCRASAPKMQTLYQNMKDRRCNVNVYMMLFEGPRVGLPCDSANAVRFATTYGLTLPIIINIGTFVTGLVGQYTSQYIQSAIPFFMIITPNLSDPGSSSVQIISGEDPDLVQMIESKLPPTACKK